MPLIGALDIAFGALTAVAAVLLVQRRVPPNRWLGVNLRAAEGNSSVWYQASAAMGRDMFVLAALCFFAGLAEALLPGGSASLCRLALSIGLLTVTIRSHLHVTRLARAKQDSDASAA
jgi:hypothetical protein